MGAYVLQNRTKGMLTFARLQNATIAPHSPDLLSSVQFFTGFATLSPHSENHYRHGFYSTLPDGFLKDADKPLTHPSQGCCNPLHTRKLLIYIYTLLPKPRVDLLQHDFFPTIVQGLRGPFGKQVYQLSSLSLGGPYI